jgi:hypothetical protein
VPWHISGKEYRFKSLKKNESFMKSNCKLLLRDAIPPKEKATEKDNTSEKEEETAGGRYVFMLFTYFVEVINIVFGKSTMKTCGCRAKGYVRNEYRCVVNACVVNIICFYSVSKKTAVLPAKKPKASVVGKKLLGMYILSHVAKLIKFLYKTCLPTNNTRATVGKTKV